MISSLLWIVLTITGLGLFLAMALYLVARKFKVEEDPRIEQIEQVMPGANCGGCGHAGCHAFAAAAVSADNLDECFCPVGGNETMKKVAAILGKEVREKSPMVAVLKCNGSCSVRERINEYDGSSSCKVKSSLYAGDTLCRFGCLGCGDCVSACEFGGISIDPETRLPVFDKERCLGCGNCVKACPKGIIELRPAGPRGMRMSVSCSNKDKGPSVRKACSVACIGCGICQKTCRFGAVSVVDNLAYIDPEKCKLCRECEAMCPTGAINAVGFPKPLDKEAVKARVFERQKKEREAAAAQAAADNQKKED